MELAETTWAVEVSEKIFKKVCASAGRNPGKIPYSAKDGVFDDWSDRITWWTNGFYAGQLWQLYHAYGTPLFRQMAESIEGKLDENLMNYAGLDHDNGFKWLLTSAADYRLTGNEASRNRALLAAANLAGRFHLAGRYIRAWNDDGDGKNAGLAIIDCMMNLPLLYWASKETRDPGFAQIAMAHADTVMRYFVRENGSVHHIVRFDPETGRMIEPLAGQGYAVGSAWTRGQAWAIYGFALSYLHTGKKEYLDTAKKVAGYFVKNIPQNGLIPVDFDQPETCSLEDSTAAAIASCGLLEIERLTEDREEKAFFHAAALRLLVTLDGQRCNWDTQTDPILEKGTAAYHDEEHHFPIIYGDYFFTEAVWKLTGKEVFLW